MSYLVGKGLSYLEAFRIGYETAVVACREIFPWGETVLGLGIRWHSMDHFEDRFHRMWRLGRDIRTDSKPHFLFFRRLSYHWM
jgi:hypothetical protein